MKILLTFVLCVFGVGMSEAARAEAEHDEEMILPLAKRQVAFFMGLVPAPVKRNMACRCERQTNVACYYIGGGGDLVDYFYRYNVKGSKAAEECQAEANRLNSYIVSARAAGDKKIGFLISDSGKVSLRRITRGKTESRLDEKSRSGGGRRH